MWDIQAELWSQWGTAVLWPWWVLVPGAGGEWLHATWGGTVHDTLSLLLSLACGRGLRSPLQWQGSVNDEMGPRVQVSGSCYVVAMGCGHTQCGCYGMWSHTMWLLWSVVTCCGVAMWCVERWEIEWGFTCSLIFATAANLTCTQRPMWYQTLISWDHTTRISLTSTSQENSGGDHMVTCLSSVTQRFLFCIMSTVVPQSNPHSNLNWCILLF